MVIRLILISGSQIIDFCGNACSCVLMEVTAAPRDIIYNVNYKKFMYIYQFLRKVSKYFLPLRRYSDWNRAIHWNFSTSIKLVYQHLIHLINNDFFQTEGFHDFFILIMDLLFTLIFHSLSNGSGSDDLFPSINAIVNHIWQTATKSEWERKFSIKCLCFHTVRIKYFQYSSGVAFSQS